MEWKNFFREADLDIREPLNLKTLVKNNEVGGSAVQGGSAAEYHLQQGSSVQFSASAGFCAAVDEFEFSQDVGVEASSLVFSASDQTESRLTLQLPLPGADGAQKNKLNLRPHAVIELMNEGSRVLSETSVPGEESSSPSHFSTPDAFHYKVQIDNGVIRLGTTLLQSPSDHPRAAEIDPLTNIEIKVQFEATAFSCLKEFSFTALGTPGVLRLHKIHLQNRAIQERDRKKPNLSVRGSVQFPKGIGPTHPVVVHLEPIGKDRKTKWHRTTQMASNGSFEFDDVDPFQYNVWATMRADHNLLMTGSCPAVVKTDKQGLQTNTWVTFKHTLPLDRAKASTRQLCKSGILLLSSSPDKDTLRP